MTHRSESMPRRPFSMLICLAFLIFSACGGGGSGYSNTDSSHRSAARLWDEAILDAIRIDTPRPPVHARNLWHLSMAMYDAWAAFDARATGFLFQEKFSTATAEEQKAAREEAISFAAYRILRNRYALSANAEETFAALDALMVELGYDSTFTDVTGASPAAIGNRIAAGVIAFGDQDGSNQAGNYADPTYAPRNPPLVVAFPGNEMTDPNAWQPLALQVAFTQNGLPQPGGVQPFVGARWGGVAPFALQNGSATAPAVDPGPPPRFGGSSDPELRAEVMEVVQKSSVLSADAPAALDISPGAYGNNPLGTNDGAGRPLNPFTGKPYAPEVVKLGDFARVLAEFWADGPKSETPPGHWNTIANAVSDHVAQTFRFQGQGAPLDRLEWDVKLYFALNGAEHDAAVNCWGLKRVYDSPRPISLIRYMATRGQSSDQHLPSYDPAGLPLIPGLSELITEESWPAGRHAGIRCCVSQSGIPAPCEDSQGNVGVEISCVGEVAVLSWPGQPKDRTNTASGVRWIRAKEWIPYQLDTFVTPAFPGYNSGHSTFSRAAAEVLAAFTGSEFFPGGLGEFVAEKNSFLTFEQGPSEQVRLQWATYFDAADQAGQSRLFGGIHLRSDDLTGRIAGSVIGRAAFSKAKSYFETPPAF